MLPSQITGVTQVMPIWGLRYGIGTSIGEVEIDEVTSHASGVDYYNVSAGLRGSAPMFPGANAIFFGGVDGTMYKPATGGSDISRLGFHFGGGLMLKLLNTVWFRTDARFTQRPGSILSINVGLVYRAF